MAQTAVVAQVWNWPDGNITSLSLPAVQDANPPYEMQPKAGVDYKSYAPAYPSHVYQGVPGFLPEGSTIKGGSYLQLSPTEELAIEGAPYKFNASGPTSPSANLTAAQGGAPAPAPAPAEPTSHEEVEDPDSQFFGQSYTDPTTKVTYQFDPQAAVSVWYWEQQGLSLADANDKAAHAAAKLGTTVIQPPAAAPPAPSHPGDTLNPTYETPPGQSLPVNQAPAPEPSAPASGGSGPAVGTGGFSFSSVVGQVKAWPTWEKVVAGAGGLYLLYRIFR